MESQSPASSLSHLESAMALRMVRERTQNEPETNPRSEPRLYQLWDQLELIAGVFFAGKLAGWNSGVRVHCAAKRGELPRARVQILYTFALRRRGLEADPRGRPWDFIRLEHGQDGHATWHGLPACDSQAMNL